MLPIAHTMMLNKENNDVKEKTGKLLPIGILIAITLILCFFFLLHYSKSPKATLDNTPVVSTMTLKKEKLPYLIKLPGTLVPFETVDIFAKASGFIETMPVDRGSFVKQGDLLAQLIDPQLERAIEGARSTYEAAYEQFKRAKPVAAQSVSQAGLAALKGVADVALKAWQALLAQKSFLTVQAPFDGIVTTRYLHPGTLVNATR